MAGQIQVSGSIPEGQTTTQVAYFVIDKANQAVLGRFVLPDAAERIRGFDLLVSVTSRADAYDVGVFESEGRFVSAGFAIESKFSAHGAAGAAA